MMRAARFIAITSVLMLGAIETRREYVPKALKALADEGTVPMTKVAEAIKKYGINADKINPLYA